MLTLTFGGYVLLGFLIVSLVTFASLVITRTSNDYLLCVSAYILFILLLLSFLSPVKWSNEKDISVFIVHEMDGRYAVQVNNTAEFITDTILIHRILTKPETIALRHGYSLFGIHASGPNIVSVD